MPKPQKRKTLANWILNSEAGARFLYYCDGKHPSQVAKEIQVYSVRYAVRVSTRVCYLVSHDGEAIEKVVEITNLGAKP